MPLILVCNAAIAWCVQRHCMVARARVLRQLRTMDEAHHSFEAAAERLTTQCRQTARSQACLIGRSKPRGAEKGERREWPTPETEQWCSRLDRVLVLSAVRAHDHSSTGEVLAP